MAKEEVTILVKCLMTQSVSKLLGCHGYISDFNYDGVICIPQLVSIYIMEFFKIYKVTTFRYWKIGNTGEGSSKKRNVKDMFYFHSRFLP